HQAARRAVRRAYGPRFLEAPDRGHAEGPAAR
ncbi:DUF6181 family protein, partial [Streptomyces hundungensis]